MFDQTNQELFVRFKQIFFLTVIAFALAACASDTGARDATRIETDQNTGSIRFIVNGQEEARVDADGMHVRQTIAAESQALGASYRSDAPTSGTK